MKNFDKYKREYYPAPASNYKWVKKEYIDHAPIWCSVDLRDGNQALAVPMNLEQKIEFFKMLVKLGFKEIEAGFPAASDTEYAFLRTLIEQNLIPDDVTIQVLTQAREHIIKRTFEALGGVKNAIVHMYNPTSFVQREQVFKKTPEQIKKIAVTGAKALKKYADTADGCIRFEYSPESFTGTEPEYALDVCNSVLDIWQPTQDKKAIIDLPVTVELSLPHIYANQVEYICDNLNYRDSVIVSLHPHNDRGCSIADTELGLLAGAQRVEGTLFGNGERTGNADIITIAMNMYSHGIDPKLNFENLPEISDKYEKLTSMTVNPRQPYAGKLVFAAFSGSHQDAIAKGMQYRAENNLKTWSVPYLPIDPRDVGRDYESDVIRINSQSGKGGIGYILQSHFGYTLPQKMREHFGYYVKGISDRRHKELKPDKIFEAFSNGFLNICSPLRFKEVHYVQNDGITASITVRYDDAEKTYTAKGNGRIDSVANALRENFLGQYHITTYEEHSLTTKSDSKAAAYICITGDESKKDYWGVGTDDDIINASIKALISAINNMLTDENRR